MRVKQKQLAETTWGQRLLRWVNLRPEESDRTFSMFFFYTVTSIGLLWMEASTVALFLDRYGANSLPWIYVIGAGIASGLGLMYSWMQRVFPLRKVIVVIGFLMALPLLLFWFGLQWPVLAAITVFGMRLWLEAIYTLNDLNASITANQLFNIREIKRAFPLISSGVLVADVVSGFALPVLVALLGLPNVILVACVFMTLGACVLFYLSRTYQSFFPDTPQSRGEGRSHFRNRRIQGPLQRYVMLLFGFFIMLQVLFLLVDFQYLSQLELNLSGGSIASFLGLFSGVLGIFELTTQWFASSRTIEQVGVFRSAMLLPAAIAFTAASSFIALWVGPLFFFLIVILMKFLDELLRYTLVASISPVLFQPLPDSISSRVQSVVRGIAEPISTGFTGLGILCVIWVCRHVFPNLSARDLQAFQGWIFIGVTLIAAMMWFGIVYWLRSGYVDLLVLSAERGELGTSDINPRSLKRAVSETLEKPGTDEHKRSCLEMLSQLYPQDVGEVVAHILPKLSPTLQRQGLEAMLVHPSPLYIEPVRSLLTMGPPPDVLALVLRYIWLTEAEPDIQQLRSYLHPEMDPIVRGTAAAMMLRRGNPIQKAEATNVLRRMLTHRRERERMTGCLALGEALYLQALRIHIPKLLQDESLRVRCALLEAIAATQLREYYPSLIQGLHYPSTRDAAMRALVRLGNEVLPLLIEQAQDMHKPELIRMQAWSAIGQIGTLEAIEALVQYVILSWGNERRNVLRVLLKLPKHQTAIAEDLLGRKQVEDLIDQELRFLGEIYAVLLDLAPEHIQGREAELLQRSLQDMQSDTLERLFLLLRFLYPSGAVQAAAFNLQSHSRANVARGLEILDNTLDLGRKRSLLIVLDRRSTLEKLQSLSDLVTYEPMTPSDRLRYLMDRQHFLSDWGLACCFHLAYRARWSIPAEQTLACLSHPIGFVREAVLSYLSMASPRTLREILPMMANDPNRLVAHQVARLMQEMGISAPGANSASSPRSPAPERSTSTMQFRPT